MIDGRRAAGQRRLLGQGRRLQGGGIPSLMLRICDQPVSALPSSLACGEANDLIAAMLEKCPEDRPSILGAPPAC